VGVESLRRCEEDVGGLVLGDRLKVPGWSLERWDCNAPKGPWSVVIRGTGGHFGVQSAVATFPVGSARTGTVVSGPPGGLWDPVLRRLVWPLAGSHAQIIGDLGPATLANLARSIAVVGGKPHLRARGGYTAVSTIPYASTVVHEMRYVTAALGQVGTLGEGSLYTGAMSGASFESAALEAHARSAGSVRGRPAIYFEVAGRFGTLAWQPAPGQVSYIGFSGASIRPDAVEALRALANRGKALTPSQW
jgi:hypothetical protein